MDLPEQSIATVPRFLGEPGSRHFILQFVPQAPRAHILFLPPFAEEMNRCRALVAQQARNLAAAGYCVTLLDFCGTGDSEGSLDAASMELWRGNIDLTIETLRDEADLPVVLWGLRLGALTALDVAARPGAEFAHLMLWHPVSSGKRYIAQLLRQRVAAVANEGLPPETTAEIRQRLAQGEVLEVSGYHVGEPLIADIEKMSVEAAELRCSGSVFWLENVAGPGDSLPTASDKAAARLQEAGNRLEVHTFTAPPIWQLHKRDEAPALLELTCSLLAGDASGTGDAPSLQ